MKAYLKELILAAIVVASALYLLLQWSGGGDPKGPESRGGGATNTTCVSEEFTMRDEWLTGLIASGQKFRSIVNWRECGRGIERGDIVLYKTSNAHEPVARVVAARASDRFKLIAVENGWNIEINGDLFTELNTKSAYRFGSPSPPLIRLYEQAHAGLLDSTSLLIFSTKSPGDQDSGSLGVLNTADIVGVVEIP